MLAPRMETRSPLQMATWKDSLPGSNGIIGGRMMPERVRANRLGSFPRVPIGGLKRSRTGPPDWLGESARIGVLFIPNWVSGIPGGIAGC